MDGTLFDLSGNPRLYRVKSPMNYTGGKYDLLGVLLERMPREITVFVDAFCGGLNVGANAPATSLIAVDCQKDVVSVLSWIRETEPDVSVSTIKQIVRSFDLGRTPKSEHSRHVAKVDAGGPSTETLDVEDSSVPNEPEKARSEYDQNYRVLRAEHNAAWVSKAKTVRNFDRRACLYALIVHGFNSQVRFGPNGYNIPFGERTFNDSIERNLHEFCSRLRSLQTTFLSDGYQSALDGITLPEGSYVYADPPYSITMAPYNTQWSNRDDEDLFQTLDRLNAQGVRFGLSNVFRHAEKVNEPLIKWSERYHVHMLDKRYDTASYNVKDGRRSSITTEVFVTNYLREHDG